MSAFESRSSQSLARVSHETISSRVVNGLLCLASIVGMAYALYLEHVVKLDPCPLCIFQRVGLILMGIFALIACIHHPRSSALKRFYAVLTSLALAWSVGVAARQVWLQHLPADQVPACGPGLNYLVDALPFKEVLAQVLKGSGECAKIDYTILGQSIAFWSLIFFSALLLVSLWQLLRRYGSTTTRTM